MTLKRTKLTLAASVLPLIAALALLGGCKNFMSNDTDFKANIQKAVDVANAAQVTVTVAPSDTSQGSTTPYPSATAKVDVPFTITASASSSYGFIRWAAYIGTSSTTEVAGLVSFGDPKAAITTATVNANRSDLVIRPIFEVRPKVKMQLPEPTSGYYNAAIQYTFNKAIDPASFTFDSGADKGLTKSAAGLFKNITVKTFITDESLEKAYFGSPSLSDDGFVLTIPLKDSTNGLYDYKDYKIQVIISKNIVDTSGLHMTDDDTYLFTVGGSKDDTPPVLWDINAGSDLSAQWGWFTVKGNAPDDVQLRRISAVSDSFPFYLQLKGTDDGSGIFNAFVTESLTAYDKDGNQTSAATETYEKPLAGASPYKIKFITSNPLKTTGDGLVTLSVYLKDCAGNKGEGSTKSYSFVRDTTPPDTAAMKSHIGMGGYTVTAGMFNATDTIKFTSSLPVVDVGYEGNGTIPRMRSATVQYRFGVSSTVPTAETATKTWTAWTDSASMASLPVTGSGLTDGMNIPVYFQLRDDLLNTSTRADYGAITVDATPPTSPAIAITAATTKVKNGTTTKFVNSNDIGYTVSAVDATSGVDKYYVSETSTAPAGNAPDWKNYSTSTVNAGTYTLTATGDSKKTLYAWFMDKAGNITASAVSDSAYKDSTAPTISNFWMQSGASLSTSVTTTASPGDQYAKGQDYYFAFYANEGDTGCGFDQFAYVDSKGSATPYWFDLVNNLAAQGTDPVVVSLLNVKAMKTQGDGTVTEVLVTGKLRVNTTNDAHSITVSVKDLAGNSSSVTSDGTNRLIFDNKLPFVTAASVTEGYSSGQYYFVKGLGPYTLSASASDYQTSGGEAVSGIASASVTADAGVLAANPADIAFTDSAQKGTVSVSSKTTTFTLKTGSADGSKKVYITPKDWAGNEGSQFPVLVYLDTAAPVFSMTLTDSIAQTVATKSSGLPEAIAVDSGHSGMTNFYVTTSPLADASGIPAAASNHVFQLYTRDKDGADTALGGPDTISPSAAKSVTVIPTKSTTYVAGVRLKDNAGNLSDEQKIGYVYDVTKPETPLVEACDASGNAFVTKYGKQWYKGSTVYLHAKATDRPAGDPDGSGIKTISVILSTSASSSPSDVRTYAAGTYTKDDMNDTITYDKSSDWFFLKNQDKTSRAGAANLTSPVHPMFSGISEPYVLRVYVRFTDAVGNYNDAYSAASPLDIRPDNVGPYLGTGLGYTGLTRGYTAGCLYTRHTGGATPSFNETIADAGIGVKQWRLESSDNALLWDTQSAWQSSPGTSSGDASYLYNDTSLCQDTTLLPDGTAKYLRLCMKDYLDNTTYDASPFSSSRYQMDNTAPVVNSLTLSSSGSSVTTNSSAVTMSVNLTEKGSGVKTLTFGGDIALNATQSLPVSSYSVSGNVITFDTSAVGGTSFVPGGPSAFTLSITGSLTKPNDVNSVTVTATDCVGIPSAVSAPSTILYDNLPPSGVSIDVNGGDHTLANGAKANVSIAYTEALSGVKTVTLAGGAYSSLSGVSIYKGGTVDATGYTGGGTLLTNVTDYSVSGNVITFTSNQMTTGTINICGVSLVGSMASGTSSGTLTATLTDNAANISAAASITTLSRDITPPILSGVTLTSTGLAGYSNTGTVTAYVTYTEIESGLKTFVFTGISGVDTATLSVGGLTSASGALGFTTTGSGASAVTTVTIKPGYEYRIGTGATVDVVGLKLDPATQGSRTVSVTIKDMATNASVAAAPTNQASINLDTVSPAGGTVTFDGGSTKTNALTHYIEIPITEATSGVKTVELGGGGYASLTAPTVSYNGAALATPGDYSISGSTITFVTGKTSGTVKVTGVTLNPGASGGGTDGSRTVTAALTDVAGNSTGTEGSGSITLDTVSPDAGTVTFNGGGSSYTNSATNYIEIPITEATSGVKTVVLGGGGYASLTTPTVSYNGAALATPGDYSISGSTITFVTGKTGGTVKVTGVRLTAGASGGGTDGSRTVTATLTDYAGNNSGAVGSGSITLDTVSPAGGTVTYNGGGSSYTNSATNYIEIPVTEDTSGVKTVVLGGSGYSSLSSPIVSYNGAALATPADYSISGSTITFVTGKTSGTVKVTGVTLNPGASDGGTDGSRAVTATLADVAGNSSGTAGSGSITLDTVSPDAGTVTFDGGSTKTNALTHYIEIPITEATSGVKTVALGGVGYASLTTPTVSYNGAALATPGDYSISGSTITFVTRKTTGTVKVTGVTLNPGASGGGTDGSRTVTAALTDVAGNSTGTEGSGSITLDTVSPDAGTVTFNGGGSSYTNSATNYIEIPVTEDTSGVKTVALGGGGYASLTTPTVSYNGAALATPGDYSISGSTITFVTGKTGGTVKVTGVRLTAGASGGGTDGSRTVTATLTDYAGNNSGAVGSGSITLDTVSPAGGTVTFNGGGSSYTDTATNYIEIPVTEATSGVKTVVLGGGGYASLSTPIVSYNGTELATPADYSISGSTITFVTGRTGGTVKVTGVTLNPGASDGGTDGSRAMTATLADVAGNSSGTAGSGSITLDTVSPDAGTVTFDGGSTKTNALTHYIEIPITEATSGVKTVELGGSGYASLTTPTVSYNGAALATPGDYSISGSTITFVTGKTSGTVKVTGVTLNPGASGGGTDGSRTVTAALTDVAGNSTGTEGSGSITLDTVSPDAGTVTFNGGGSSYANSATNYIEIPITEDTSGVKTVVLGGGGYASLSTPTVSYNGAALATPADYSISGSTITFVTGKTGGTVKVTGVRLTAGASGGGTDGSRTVTATLTDYAGNNSGAVGSGSITLDTVSPAGGTVTYNGGGSSYTNSATNYIEIPITEDTSGVKTVVLGGSGYSSLSSPIVSYNGAALATPADYSISGGTITFVTGKTSGTVKVTGVTLNPGASDGGTDGSRAVTATLADVAGNSSGTAGSGSITLDTIAPSCSTMTVTCTGAGSGHYQYYRIDGTSGTLFMKDGTENITLTPASVTDAGGSGPATPSAVPLTGPLTDGGTTTLSLFDNAGNTTSVTVTYAIIASAPVISLSGSVAGTNSTITGISTISAATGLGVNSYTSSSGTFDGSQITALSALGKPGSAKITVTATDNVGRVRTYMITRDRDSGGTYTISFTAGDTNSSASHWGVVPVTVGTIGSQYAMRVSTMRDAVTGVSGKRLSVWDQAFSATQQTDSLSGKDAVQSAPASSDVMTIRDETTFSTLSTRHAQALALARARFALSQNTDAAQNAADKNISPETANNGKQDDSGRMNGVGYNQELVRIAKSAMAPLAEQYLALHGVSMDGTLQSAEGRMAGAQTAGLQIGLTAGPEIGMLIPAKRFQAFRREQDFGSVS